MTIDFAAVIPEWASNTNYSAGPDTGAATKVDPASAANGFIRGVNAAAQHVNFELNAITVAHNHDVPAANRLLAIAALHLHPLTYVSSDTGAAMGATMVDGIAAPGAPVIAIKVDGTGVAQTYDNADVDTGGVVASVSSLVREAETNGTRICAIGIGGNLNTYSDNGGGTWSAGAAGIGGTAEYLVYAPANALSGGGNRFYTGGSAGSVFSTATPSTVWTSAASSFATVRGLAVLGGSTVDKGYVIVLGNSGIQPRFSLGTNGSGSVFTGTQTPPNAATAEEPGSLAGCPRVPTTGANVYHIMRCNAGARIRTNYTASGVNDAAWIAGTTIEVPAGGTFSALPRLMICQTTGLMVIAAPMSSGVTALYASRDFVTWVGPACIKSISNNALAVAGGKLFATRGAVIYASAGIGR